MNGQVFLVSEYIEGEPLESFLEKAKEKPEDFILNEESFQRLVIFCLLTNPEDCRLQNCLVRQIENSQEYEVILIDNERSFGRAFTDEILQEDKKISTRVHCVLFCFYEMLQRKMHPKVLSEIARSPTIDMLAKQFVEENEYHKNLANQGCILEQTVGIQYRKTILGVPLGSEFLERISYSWPRIIASIQAGKNLTSIFVEEHPEIAELYSLQISTTQHNMFEHILERIKTIDKGRHASRTPSSSCFPLQIYFKSPKELIIDPKNWASIIARARDFFTIQMNESMRIEVIEAIARSEEPSINKTNGSVLINAVKTSGIDPSKWNEVIARVQDLTTEQMERHIFIEIVETIKDMNQTQWEEVKSRAQNIMPPKMREKEGAWKRFLLIKAVKDINPALWGEIKTRVQDIMPLQAGSDECISIINAVKYMDHNEWEEAKVKTQDMILAEKDGRDRARIITAVKDIHLSRWEEIKTRMQDMATEGMSGRERAEIIKVVKNIDADQWADVKARAEAIIARQLKMRGEEIAKIIKMVKNIDQTLWEGIRTRAQDIITPQMGGDERASIIRAVKNIDAELWEGIRTRAQVVITENMSGREYAEIIKAVQDINSSQWEEICTRVEDIIQDIIAEDINGYEYAEIIRSVKNIPSNRWEEVKIRAGEMITRQMNGKERAQIVEVIKDIDSIQWIDILEKAHQKITRQMGGEERSRIIRGVKDVKWTDVTGAKVLTAQMSEEECIKIENAVQDIEPEKRTGVIARAQGIITSQMEGEESASIIKALRNIDHNQWVSVKDTIQTIIFPEMDGWERAWVIEAVATDPEDWEDACKSCIDIIARAQDIITEGMRGYEKWIKMGKY